MLIIRDYHERDRQDFIRLNTCPINRAHMNGAHSHESASRLFDKLQGEGSTIARAVEVKGRYVGHLFISEQEEGWELGFIFDYACWGQGYATRALKMLMEQLPDNLPTQRLFATIDEGHSASERVIEKLGFIQASRHEDEYGVYYLYRLVN
ncbi:GNAT family N-acetyltransferase [Vibrio breoganii]